MVSRQGAEVLPHPLLRSSCEAEPLGVGLRRGTMEALQDTLDPTLGLQRDGVRGHEPLLQEPVDAVIGYGGMGQVGDVQRAALSGDPTGQAARARQGSTAGLGGDASTGGGLQHPGHLVVEQDVGGIHSELVERLLGDEGEGLTQVAASGDGGVDPGEGP